MCLHMDCEDIWNLTGPIKLIRFDLSQAIAAAESLGLLSCLVVNLRPIFMALRAFNKFSSKTIQLQQFIHLIDSC